MTDFDDALRDAVAGAAGATVAPPFAAVERRARARRHRQVAATAIGTVAILAAAAVAMPGGSRHGLPAGPSPAPEPTLIDCTAISFNPDDRSDVRCYIEEVEDAPCGEFPDPTNEEVRTLASGTVGGTRWGVLAWQEDGTRCVGYHVPPDTDPMSPSDRQDSGPDGALRPLLSWDLLVNGPTDAVIWWGAVPPEVVRVEWVVDGEKRSFPTYVGGDRRYVAAVLSGPDGLRVQHPPVGYDAAGNPVTLPEARP